MHDSKLAPRAAVAVLLAAVTFGVYADVRHHEFLNYDDGEYVTENPAVRAGLTPSSVVWALTSIHSATWHPLTGLSHMLDCELFGLDAGAHLAVNVVLHVAAVLVLLATLHTATGELLPSAFVAALFALHPLHVESVAWVSERKDVLSGLLWMLTMWCYVRYARRPSRSRYLLVAVAFTTGLLAKPMLVTLPFVLLLLDLWPLGRLATDGGGARADAPSAARPTRRRGAGSRASAPARDVVSPRRGASAARPAVVPSRLGTLVIEKVPLLVLAAAMSAITYVVQSRAGAIASFASVPLADRLANAVVSYVWYLAKTLWPTGLAVFYPLHLPIPLWQVLGALVVLVGISLLAARNVGRHPYLLVGWAWYLGTLVPVIGIVRAGEQARADRFTYLPLIGIFLMIAWGIPALLAGWRHRRPALAAGAAAASVALAIASWFQVRYWRNSSTLFRHALAVTDGNYVAHNNLAVALDRSGDADEAMRHYAAALALKPDYARAHVNVGQALAARGDAAAAAAHYAQALEIDPASAMAHYDLGLLLAGEGKLDDAIRHYRAAIRSDPGYAKAYNNLGWALAEEGKVDAAVAEYRQALRRDPAMAAAHNNLGVALERLGRPGEAVEQYAAAVRLIPDDAKARFNYAGALGDAGRGDEAIAQYREAARLAPELPQARYALGAALAARGRAREAIAEYRAALRSKADWPEVERDLAWLLATADEPGLREPREAVALAESAERGTAGKDPEVLRVLAAAYAAADRFGDATQAAERALELARRGNRATLVEDLEARLRAYRQAEHVTPGVRG